MTDLQQYIGHVNIERNCESTNGKGMDKTPI